MVDINMYTVIVIYSICFILGLVFITTYFVLSEKEEINRYYLAFFLLSSIGSLLVYFRDDVGLFVSIILANLSLVIGNCLLVIGIRKSYQQKVLPAFFITVVSVFLLIFTYLTYINPNVILRVITYNVIVIVILFYGLVSLNYIRKAHKTNELMSLVLSIIVLAMTLRVIVIIFIGETQEQFLEFVVDPLLLVVVGLANMLVITGYFSIINDLKNRTIKESERSKSSLLSNLPGFAYRCLNDENWTMKFLSHGFTDIVGYDIESVIENKDISYNDIVSEEFRETIRIGWNRALSKNERFVSEYQITRLDGEVIWVWEQGIGIFDDKGECIAIEGFITDIDSRKNLEKSLEYLSYRDSLTGLYNRRFIEDQIERLEKSRHIPISVIMGDINGLKFINDSFGHNHGDELISIVAKILQESIREHELIARIGGDEFVILLEATTNSQAQKIVARILKKCKKNEYAKMGLSIALGYSTKTDKNESLHDVIKDAEDMMYRQKLYEKPSSRRKTVDAVLGTLFEKDRFSEVHSRNVSRYSKMLAQAAGLTQNEITQTETVGLLHDVGKIIIDARILKSNTLLTDEDYESIQKHCEIGYRILNSVPEFEEIAQIILCHHERPDGKGYPNKLKGHEIPYISKIISICDAYDAMVNQRIYKPSISKEEACEELRRFSGKQFDANLVEIFVKCIDNEMTK